MEENACIKVEEEVGVEARVEEEVENESPQQPQPQPQALQYPHDPTHNPNHNNSEVLLSHYEAEMRGHAVAYASAAANAAWVAAMVAQQRATEASHLAAQLMVQSQQYPHQHPSMFMNMHPQTYYPYQSTFNQDHGANTYNENETVNKKRCKTNGNFHRRRHKEGNSNEVPSSSSIEYHNQQSQQNNQQNSSSNDDRKKKKRLGVVGTHNQYQAELPCNKFRRNSNNSNSTFGASLVGKTGVCALYELCSKKRWGVPRFVCISTDNTVTSNKNTNSSSSRAAVSDCSSVSSMASGSGGALQFHEYIIEVEIGGRVFGRGRAGTKATARQDAARQAIISILPGVAFDINGALVDMSSFRRPSSSPVPSSLDSSSIHSGHSSIVSDSKVKVKHSTQSYQQGGGYISGISSLSEDDDAYFSSRGASACSGLLHTMWQIDERIIEAPSFSYDLCPIATSSPSRKNIPQHRPSFACTARLILDHNQNNGIAAVGSELHSENISGKSELEELVAVGTSTIKKEAKHIASAKLLSMLFPQCQSTTDAMAAAESAKEKYAAKRAAERHSKKQKSNGAKLPGMISHAALKSISPLPQRSKEYLSAVAKVHEEKKKTFENDEEGSSNIHADNTIGVATLSLSEPSDFVPSEKALDKTFLRENLVSENYYSTLCDKVDDALQLLELDEEGRASCQSNPDDIGRTILRRAHFHDYDKVVTMRSIEKTSTNDISREDPLGLICPNIEIRSEAKRLWGQNVALVVLSRAVLNESEPIMGFAVLSLQFSYIKGRVLSVLELRFAEHLPRERFVESLTHLASLMNIELVDENMPSNETESSWLSIDSESIRDIFNRIPCMKEKSVRVLKKSTRKSDIPKAVPLQSVTEEDEEHYTSSGVPLSTGDNVQSAQPTKRSRVS